jgi:N-succinyldiaminopimelate aminotransferase
MGGNVTALGRAVLSAAMRAPLSSKLQPFGETIFAEMSALATRTGAINLGQGFPDTDGPPEIAEAAIAAIRSGQNQYPPGIGIPDLRHAISEHRQRFYRQSFDPDTEVLVTAGATEAIAATILAVCEPGDEVVVFEPYYDSYSACIAMAGAARVPVTLHAPGYTFDEAALRAAIGPRTRVVLLNSPHNPTGKVFTEAELSLIAELCVANDLIAVTDEVYEHLTFDGITHRPLATFPGMADRTITISSAGKTFSYTGWKIGWVCARSELVTAVKTAKQFLTYVNGAPFQPAIAVGLRLGDEYFEAFARELEHKRDLLCAGLDAAGFDVIRPSGTYFVTCDIRPFGATDGRAFCLSMPERCGVVAIPNSVFYDDKAAGQHLIRFTFCKRVEVLDAACERLTTLGR